MLCYSKPGQTLLSSQEFPRPHCLREHHASAAGTHAAATLTASCGFSSHGTLPFWVVPLQYDRLGRCKDCTVCILQYLYSSVLPLATSSFLSWLCHHIYYNYVNKPVFLKNSCFHYPETHFQSFLIYPYQVISDLLYKCKGELYAMSKS